MARLIGIDIRKNHVRAVLVRTARRPTIERMLEADVALLGTPEDTVRACVAPLLDAHVEGLAVAVEGDQAFIRRLELPSSAKKQLDEVLPFEIEAQVPIELDELVFDYRLLAESDPATLSILTAASRIDTVRDRIRLVGDTVGREPERVGCGALPLANLTSVAPALGAPGPLAVVDLSGAVTDVLVMVAGQPMFARTLSIGMQDLPDGAARLMAEVGQTLLAWAALWPVPVERVYLVGSGSADPNACAYLAHMLGLPTEVLAMPAFGDLSDEHRAALPRYAKAIALAFGVDRGRDLDLRQGPLVIQQRYDFLKENMPLFAGLGAAILISFLFFLWADLRSLGREEKLLGSALEVVSREVLGEKTRDPERVKELIDRGKNPALGDPMPHADAFDVLVKLSEGIPPDLTHDIEEFDMSRGKVKLNGVVATQADAQKVASLVKDWQCAKDLKIGKITQVVNDTRQKYSLEFDVRCPEDDTKKPAKKKKEETAPPAEGKAP
jgi:general secretion pathway protein L